MLPAYIIIKILEYNFKEADTYIFIFNNQRIKTALTKIINSELFKWTYLVKKKKHYNFINLALCSSNLEVVKLALSNGAKKYRNMLKSENIEVVKWGFKYCKRLTLCNFPFNTDSTELVELLKNNKHIKILNYNYGLFSDNLEIVKYCVSMGACNFNTCLSSNNLDIVNYGIGMGATMYELCLFSNNLDVVVLSKNVAFNRSLFNRCLSSDNPKVVKYGISMGATKFDQCMRSNNYKIAKFGIKKIYQKNNNCKISHNNKVNKLPLKYGGKISYTIPTLNDQVNKYSNRPYFYNKNSAAYINIELIIKFN